MTVTYLFGAGASRGAGVPTTLEMAKVIYDGSDPGSNLRETLNVVLGALRQRASVVKGDAYAEVDIEDVYAALVQLATRRQSLLGSFVAAWAAPVLQLEVPDTSGVATRIASALSRDLRRSSTLRGNAFGPELWNFQQALIGLTSPKETAAFADAATSLVYRIVDQCEVKDEGKSEYLMPLFTTATLPWIATLNYDNSLELAARKAGVSLNQGEIGPDGEFRFQSDAKDGRATLLKLHGSVDWRLEKDGRPSTEEYGGSPGILLGAGNKLRISGPYLEMLFLFRDRLEATDELHVSGYSFRDEHINHVLVRWWKRDKGRRLVIHDPSAEGLPLGDVFSDVEGEDSAHPRILLDPITTEGWLAREGEPHVPPEKPSSLGSVAPS